MSYKLEKPYTGKQRADFIVEYNHNKGLKTEETDNELYALEPWEKLVDGKVIDNTEEYEAEQMQKERERISMLSLTAADVERAIYKAKGMDFEDILELVRESQDIDIDQSQASSTEDNNDNTTHESRVTAHKIDLKALKIELKANNFYRGNPYVNIIGELLGYSSEDLDYLFKNKELPALKQEEKDVGMDI